MPDQAWRTILHNCYPDPESVEVVGFVEVAVVTWQRGTWRVVIAGSVIFAPEGDGCAQALRAAGQGGDQVHVLARRIRADLWVDYVHRC